MTDSQITKKVSLSGSFTRRILFVVILLLIIPLFLQTFFLYRQEYRQKLQDVQTDLNILTEERTLLVQEMIQSSWDLLEAYLDTDLPRNVKQLYIKQIPLPKNVGRKFLVIDEEKDILLVGIAQTMDCALVREIPLRFIAKNWPKNYPIRMSILNASGHLFWQSQKPFKNAITSFRPVTHTPFVLELSSSKDRIHGLHLSSYYLRFLTLLLFVGFLGGGAVYLFTKRIAKPFRKLRQAMQKASDGSNHVRYKKDWLGFEINILGDQFNQMIEKLTAYHQEIQEEKIRREKLAKELAIGHEIQKSLFPTALIGYENLDIAADHLPALEVSGDFYDLFRTPDDKLLFVICDTAGKGISACLYSLGLRSMIRSFATQCKNLNELLVKVNNLYFLDAHESSMFSSLWTGIYDPKEKTITYASQGHHPVLLLRDGVLFHLNTKNIAVGAQSLETIEIEKQSLQKGDSLLFYTDGIIEAQNKDRELFGMNKLEEIFSKFSKGTSQQLVDQILREVDLFSEGVMQHDDITLLSFTIEN